MPQQSFIFHPQKVRDVLQRALKERIEGQKYDPVKGSQVGRAEMNQKLLQCCRVHGGPDTSCGACSTPNSWQMTSGSG